jgi:hypothetical protein
MEGSWRIEIPTLLDKEGVITYSEGDDSAECLYMLGGGSAAWTILGCRDWDAKYPWAAGRQESVLRRIAEAFVGRSSSWLEIEVDAKLGLVTLRRQWAVDLDDALKTGLVKYSEGPRKMEFTLVHGTGRIAFIVVGPEETRWSPFNVHSASRRHEIVARVADDVIRRLAPRCVPDYDETRPSEMRILLSSEPA